LKCGVVYNPNDKKLSASSYSQTYRDMFLALCYKFDKVLHITRSCSAEDIEADVIIFYDVHSNYDITIDGIKNHKAIKYEYFNDPHQVEHDFTRNGITVHKLGAEQRAKRANSRGVQYIICPSRDGFNKYIKPHSNATSVWFPVAPKKRLIKSVPLCGRKPSVLANGNVWDGENGFHPYEFRNWAFRQPSIEMNRAVKIGDEYQQWLSTYAGALALCDDYVVAKYIEVPLSGCVCFAQQLPEYEDMGFIDGYNCIFVNKDNFNKAIEHFKNNITEYQRIADNGKKNAENWTADKFADYIYNHARKLCQ